jgi:hypothetical protein
MSSAPHDASHCKQEMPMSEREKSGRPPIRWVPDKEVCDWIQSMADDEDRSRPYIVNRILEKAYQDRDKSGEVAK